MTTRRYEDIHNALVTACRTGVFHPQSTDKNTGLVTVDTATSVAPATVQASEDSSSFGPQDSYGGGVRERRETWVWQVTLQFQQRVNFSDFEAAMAKNPPKLNRDGDQPRTILRIRDAEYDHPGHQSGEGSKVTYSFDAEMLIV